MRTTAIVATLLLAALSLLAACGDDGSAPQPTSSPSATVAGSNAIPASPSAAAGAASSTATANAAAAFVLRSPAFADNANIPAEYSCDGKSASPELAWSGAPQSTRAFALVLHDPDAPRAGGFTHWVIYNIPASASGISAGASPGGALPPGALEGNNGSGKLGYTGPCPPKGGPAHHYQFTLYALDAPLALEAAATKDGLEQALGAHVLASAHLTGLFAH